MNQNDQMREALQAIETVLDDSYHRHFAECCDRRNENGCCCDFIEQWTPEDQKIIETLAPIQRQLSQALNHTPDTGKMVRLTDDFLIETYLLCKAEWKATNKRQRERIAVVFGKAVMDAMIARTGGSND